MNLVKLNNIFNIICTFSYSVNLMLQKGSEHSLNYIVGCKMTKRFELDFVISQIRVVLDLKGRRYELLTS